MNSPPNEGIPAAVSGSDVAPSIPALGNNPVVKVVPAQIPVVVHASRYSAPVQSGGNHPLPVHEETHTIIVFPLGAIVPLSATLTRGELVVLTNQRSTAAVLCRVAKIKSEPGTQNYVSLEFKQRAPGFWGDLFSEQRGGAYPSPASAADAPPSAASPERAAPQHMSSTLAPAETTVAPTVHTARCVAALPPPTKPTDSQPRALITGAISNPSRTGLGQANKGQKLNSPFDPHIQERTASGLHKVLLITTAAVVLAAAGVGGAVLRHLAVRRSSTSPQATLSQTSAPPEAALTQPAATPSSETDATAAATESVTTTPTKEASVQSAAPATALSVNKQARPTAAAHHTGPRLPIAIASISAPILKKHVASAVGQPPAVPDSPSAENLMAVVKNAASAPAPVEGGHIVTPKLIDSPAPTYPALARADAVQGTVVIDALVDATGKVATMKVISGPGFLLHAAIDAVRNWRYRPGRLNGQPIAMHVQVHINFRLQ